MAIQNLVEQHVAFISANNQYDENAIIANNLIQQLKANSAGNVLLKGYENTSDGYSIFELRCYVQPSFVATIQANIPNLQAAFPQYTIATWGGNVVFGN